MEAYPERLQARLSELARQGWQLEDVSKSDDKNIWTAVLLDGNGQAHIVTYAEKIGGGGGTCRTDF